MNIQIDSPSTTFEILPLTPTLCYCYLSVDAAVLGKNIIIIIMSLLRLLVNKTRWNLTGVCLEFILA